MAIKFGVGHGFIRHGHKKMPNKMDGIQFKAIADIDEKHFIDQMIRMMNKSSKGDRLKTIYGDTYDYQQ
ncbi:hypothetical protein AGMMS49928_22510 [Spirochaetia bacterium]|nr:hypothetical protein AGMMS49928_22510 [Spirochaetia bacterium]